jgi:hypothetical protein
MDIDHSDLWKQLDVYTRKLICWYEESTGYEVTLECTPALLKT